MHHGVGPTGAADLVDLRSGQSTPASECDKVLCLRKEAAAALGFALLLGCDAVREDLIALSATLGPVGG